MKEHVRKGRSGFPIAQHGQQDLETGDTSSGGFLHWPWLMSRPIDLAAPRSCVVPPKRPPTPRRTHAPRPRASRHVILFLAANPSGTTRLALDEECAAIERELRMTPGRDDFDFRSKWAVSIDEMMRYLNEWKPMIIHFSGHGSSGDGIHVHGNEHPSYAQRDIEGAKETGIYLQDDHRSQYVTGRALAQMIASAAPSARVVVLNACFSDAVAESLGDAVDCVVSMKGAVDDDAARSFAVGFYRALGNCRSVGNAVAQATATLAAKQLPAEHLPVCRTRNGISADEIFLPISHLRRP